MEDSVVAQITLNATATQSARIQQAVAVYNQQNQTSLTVKQWVYQMLREAVQTYLGADAEAAAQAVREAIETDMSGGT